MNGHTLLFAAILAAFSIAAQAANPELVSRAASPVANVTANGHSLGASFSPDGQFILFSSAATDLTAGAPNSHFDLFTLNTADNSVAMVSIGAGCGVAANGESEGGAMTRDHRYVVFQSSARNLTAGDTNIWPDIYLRDLTSATTTLITKSPVDGAAGNDRSQYPQISENGEWIVFESLASNLAANDTNRTTDILAWQRSTGALQLVSVGRTGKSMDAETGEFTLTPDGRFVVFEASGTNLVAAGKSGAGDVYVRDLQAGTTRWVSSLFTNLPGYSAATASAPEISSNGRFVFMAATIPAPGRPAFVRVDLTNDTILIVATNFTTLSGLAGPSISDDGQSVAYATGTNVFHWNGLTGETQRIDVGGAAGARLSDSPIISRNGRKVAFLSDAAELVPGLAGGAGAQQLYVRDLDTAQTVLVSKSASGAPALDLGMSYAAFAPDASTLIFDTMAGNLAVSDDNNAFDLFKWDAASGAVALLSSRRDVPPSLTAAGSSVSPQASDGGRFVVFMTFAALSQNDTNRLYDVYVYDRQQGINILVSANSDGYSPNGSSGPALITSDGKIVVFESNARGLAGAADTRTAKSVYARNLETGAIVNISGAGTGACTLWSLSGDGHFAFFNNGTICYRHDLRDGAAVRVGTGEVRSLSSSFDGSRAAFSQSTSSGLYIQDFPTGVPFRADSTATPLLSADGSILVYARSAEIVRTNLATGEVKAFPYAGATKLSMSDDASIIAYRRRVPESGFELIGYVSAASDQEVLVTALDANATSDAPVVSPDGRLIAFESWAGNLLPEDNNVWKDIFLYEIAPGRLSLLSHRADSLEPGNGISVNPEFSADGSHVVFSSVASDLVASDLNESADIFIIGVASNPGVDTDSDGLPDDWEQTHFSGLAQNAADDPDSDGMSNSLEFRAGTNPADAASVFGIRRIELRAEGSVRLIWISVNGRRYAVDFKPAIDAASWIQVGDPIPAAGSETSLDQPLPSNEGIFRIRLVE